MPAPDDIVLEHKWSYWVTAGAKAIIATTDPPLRWLMMRQGFIAFQDWARASALFDNLTPFKYSNDELRWIYETVCRYAERREGGWHSRFQARYERERRKDIERKSAPSDEPDVVTVEDKHGKVLEFKR